MKTDNIIVKGESHQKTKNHKLLWADKKDEVATRNDKSTIIVGNFNKALSETDIANKQKNVE